MSRNIRLTVFRHSRNKTQDEMAKILGVSNSYYSKIELGSRNPSFNFIKRFKAEFEVNIDKIFLKKQRHIKCDKQTA